MLCLWKNLLVVEMPEVNHGVVLFAWKLLVVNSHSSHKKSYHRTFPDAVKACHKLSFNSVFKMVMMKSGRDRCLSAFLNIWMQRGSNP